MIIIAGPLRRHGGRSSKRLAVVQSAAVLGSILHYARLRENPICSEVLGLIADWVALKLAVSPQR